MAKSAAERTCDRAVKRIEKVRREGRDQISFNHKDFRALERIPSKIAQIARLEKVDLDGIKIADLPRCPG